MSKNFGYTDVVRLLKDTKQIAELVYNTINNHLEQCKVVKKYASDLAKNVKSGLSIKKSAISGSMFMEMIEATSLAPEKLKDELMEQRNKLEVELISNTRYSRSIEQRVRKFLNVFYLAYQKHYTKIFSEQLKALVSLQSVLSQSSEELARVGAKDAQDRNIKKIKSEIDKSKEESDEDYGEWLDDEN